MASVTINGGTTFPEGSSVGAYPRSAWPSHQSPAATGAPSGSATATATVTGGLLSFTGLADGTEYVAYASSPDRYKSFSTSALNNLVGAELAYAEITAAQTGISATADITGLVITFTVGDRPVEVEAHFPLCQQVTATGLSTFFIVGAGGDVGRASPGEYAAAKFFGGFSVRARVTTPGTYTHKARAQTSAGTLSVFSTAIAATASYQAFIRARTL